jgi:hypothetical protein
MGKRVMTALVAAVALTAIFAVPAGSAGQGQGGGRGQGTAAPAAAPAAAARYTGPRTPDGKPNLNGVWQVLNSANWDLEPHNARPSPNPVEMGAMLAAPGSPGVVEGNEIPYKPAALTKKKQNAANWLKMDPETKCYMPGIPRATYMPYPFQIIQTPTNILFAYQYATANRVVPIAARKEEPAVDTWMGESFGRWDGDTLVVDAKGFNDQTWLDRAGNYHSTELHVVERFTPVDAHLINYEATIEDPQVFTRPWKISMPIYKHIENNAQLVEFRCVEFAEELLYGNLVKPGAPK